MGLASTTFCMARSGRAAVKRALEPRLARVGTDVGTAAGRPADEP
jgi:hypothetical protein